MYMVYKGLELKVRNMDTDTSALGAYTDSSLIGEEYKTAVAALLKLPKIIFTFARISGIIFL